MSNLRIVKSPACVFILSNSYERGAFIFCYHQTYSCLVGCILVDEIPDEQHFLADKRRFRRTIFIQLSFLLFITAIVLTKTVIFKQCLS